MSNLYEKIKSFMGPLLFFLRWIKDFFTGISGAVTTAVIMAVPVVLMYNKTKNLKEDVTVLENNQNALMYDVDRYKVRDSLNAVSVSALTLQVEDFEKTHKDDMRLINDLKIDNKRLQSVSISQTQTIYELNLKADSQKYVYITETDTVLKQCIDYDSKWYSIHACIGDDGSLDGTFQSRDELIYIEHVIPKRFLGFLWKYGVKERKQEIISKNPNTTISNSEFIQIKN